MAISHGRLGRQAERDGLPPGRFIPSIGTPSIRSGLSGAMVMKKTALFHCFFRV